MFVEGNAYLQIDKSYLGGNSTSYEFHLGSLGEGNRVRFAAQWIREDGEVYDAIMFILKVRPRYEDNYPVIEYYTAGGFMTNLHEHVTKAFHKNETFYDELVEFMGGENLSELRPQIDIEYQKTEAGDDNAGRTMTIRWRK
jgi:hypothetical protein